MRNERALDVLFVDDEPLLLDGLRRQLHAERGRWAMRFAQSGEQALQMLTERPADVVIADMCMPHMNGATLLREVRSRWPDAVRFILSGQTDQTELMGEIGAIHQFLQKPCPAETIRRSVARATNLTRELERGALRSMTAGIQSLPVVSETYRRLVEILEQADCDAERVAAVVEQDIGLTTKLLQMVNSAFFGLPRRTTSVKEAVIRIGIRNLRYLAVAAQIFDSLGRHNACGEAVSRLWVACTDLGAAAAHLARDAGQSQPVCESARLAGTLSLIGRALLVSGGPQRYASVLERVSATGCLLHEAEEFEVGIPQHVVGAYALGLWAFADDIIDAVLHQAAPERSEVVSPAHPLPYVHQARCAASTCLYVDSLDCAQGWLDALIGASVPQHAEGASV